MEQLIVTVGQVAGGLFALWCVIYAIGWCAVRYERYFTTSRNYR